MKDLIFIILKSPIRISQKELIEGGLAFIVFLVTIGAFYYAVRNGHIIGNDLFSKFKKIIKKRR